MDRGDRGDRPMYDATCSDCGQTCQVPFQPTEGRPVYCRACYSKHRPPRRF
ncbi:MAG: CxxC-x17-CxxC domain-containing protein [Candidatus Micrarchaeota archaeon]